MATATLKINDNEISADEFTLSVLADIITTANPGAKTVVDAVNAAGGASYLETFVTDKNPADVFEITVKISEKGQAGVKVGKGTRAVIAKRFELALSADEWQTDVIKVLDGEPATKPNGGTVRKMASL